jgi:hypothetical protein
MLSYSQVCVSCKKERDLSEFKVKTLETMTKMCVYCLERDRNTREKTKCIHNKRKYFCYLCGGTGLCIHLLPRSTCSQCADKSKCIHDKLKRICKICKYESVLCFEHGKHERSCEDCRLIKGDFKTCSKCKKDLRMSDFKIKKDLTTSRICVRCLDKDKKRPRRRLCTGINNEKPIVFKSDVL